MLRSNAMSPAPQKAGLNGHHFSFINAKELLAQEEEQAECSGKAFFQQAE